jgi:hypothetical protein
MNAARDRAMTNGGQTVSSTAAALYAHDDARAHLTVVDGDASPSDAVKVSVCVINYNYARFLPDAIESALSQDHPNLEVLVVDDGSTDDSVRVAQQYAPRVRVIRKQNGGQGSAINAAFTAATGEVIFFLDADDMLTPGTVRLAARAYFDDPTTAKIQFGMEIVDADGTPVGRQIPGPNTEFPSGDLSRRVLRARNYPWPPSSANAYSVRALSIALPIPEDVYRGDTDCYLAETTPLCGPIRSIVHTGALYRWHGSNDFAGSAGGVSWLHHKIRLVHAGHENVCRVARQVGLSMKGVPRDATDVPDMAYLGVRLGSLRLDAEAHPIPGDRPGRLALRGVLAALRHPFLSTPARVKRIGWFVAVGLLPQSVAERICDAFIPDGPYQPRWERLFGRARDDENLVESNARTRAIAG